MVSAITNRPILFDAIKIFRYASGCTDEPDKLVKIFKEWGWTQDKGVDVGTFCDKSGFAIEDWTYQAQEGRRILVIFPGGRCTEWEAIINREALQGLNEFVKKGGNYAGFCGGGYLVAKQSKFSNCDIKERKIDLFDGICEGPITPDHFVKLRQIWDGGKAYSYFKDGGVLVPNPENRNFKSLLEFEGSIHGIAAGVQEVGDGKALVCSAHPALNLSFKNPALSSSALKPFAPEANWDNIKRKISKTDGATLLYSLFQQAFS